MNSQLGLPRETVSDNPIPEKIIGYVSVEGTASVFSGKTKGLQKSARAYHARKPDRDSVQRDLQKAGFTVLAGSALEP
jgi:hypothetical protein